MSANTLLRKDAIIAVCDSSTIVRHNIISTLRSLGYKNIVPLSTPVDVKSHLQGDRLDWIITTLMSNESMSGLGLLAFLLSSHKWHTIRTSFFIEKDEATVLPSAHELGLLSWHEKVFTIDSLKMTFDTLFRRIGAYEGDDRDISASYLRDSFSSTKRFVDLIDLEQALIDFFPNQPKRLLNLAQAHLTAGHREHAMQIVRQARLMHQELDSQATDLIKLIANDDAASADMSKIPDAKLPKVCVCIEPDMAVQNQVKTILEELKIPQIHFFTDGEAAWEYLSKNPEPDLILQEWRIPKLGGVSLVQRIRDRGFLNVPIAVISSLVTERDVPILSEMSIGTVINKPFTKNDFIFNLKWLVQQESYPTEQKSLERKILQFLSQGKIRDALTLKAVYLSNEKISLGRRRYIEAQFNYHQGLLLEAKESVSESIRISGFESFATIDLLGKCLLKLGDMQGAVKCFERAQEFSPMNIRRLCEIAEIKGSSGDSDGAKAFIDEAMKVDQDSRRVLDASLAVAISTDDIKLARSIMKKNYTPTDVVAHMNNKAVAMLRSYSTEEGINLYIKTMKALPDNEKELRSIISYNLGLAYVRNKRLDLALGHLNYAASVPSSPIFARAKSLYDRTKVAMANGTTVKLSGGGVGGGALSFEDDFERFDANSKSGDGSGSKSSRKGLIESNVEPGLVCLHRVYYSPFAKIDSYTQGFLDSLQKAQNRKKPA